MCQSIQEGGRRCAAHTRPQYYLFLEHAVHVPVDQWLPDFPVSFLSAATAHASTPSGQKELREDIATLADGTLARGLLEDALERGAKELAHIDQTKRASNASSGYYTEMETPTGHIVGFHAMVRAIERGISLREVIDCIDRPTTKVRSQSRSWQMRYIKGDIQVAVDMTNRKAATIIHKPAFNSAGKVRRPYWEMTVSPALGANRAKPSVVVVEDTPAT